MNSFRKSSFNALNFTYPLFLSHPKQIKIECLNTDSYLLNNKTTSTITSTIINDNRIHYGE